MAGAILGTAIGGPIGFVAGAKIGGLIGAVGGIGGRGFNCFWEKSWFYKNNILRGKGILLDILCQR